MEDLSMPSFSDSTDLYSISSQSCTLSPTDGHFDIPFVSQTSFSSNTSFGSDASFSSSDNSFNQCYTPTASRHGSSDTIDIDGLSSCPTSLDSSGSNSPIDHKVFHALSEFSPDKKTKRPSGQDAKAQAHEFIHLYTTPRSKDVQDEQMIGFDAVDLHQTADAIPETIYNSLPSSLYNSCRSPAQLGLSPKGFVIPSQTFNGPPYRPTTPVDTPRIQITSPCSKGAQNQQMINFSCSKVSNIYDALDLHQTVDGIPEIMHGNLPGLLHSNYTSPVQLHSSPVDFVVPLQTVNGHPYRPTTPVDGPRIQLASPLASYGQRSETIKYFMSPPSDTDSFSVNFAIESPLDCNPKRKSSKRAVKSSRALQRLQAFSGHLICKQSKGPHQVTTEIERVAAGLFRCDFEGCKSKHGFKRHEHLKRHQRAHEGLKGLQCPFCSKRLADDRVDNWRAHVKLHGIKKAGSRTEYSEEAARLVREWDEEKLLKMSLKKSHAHGEVYRAHARRGQKL